MKKKEQLLQDRFLRNMNTLNQKKSCAPGRGVKLERIENMIDAGFPDVLASGLRVQALVELKAVHGYPARATTRVFGSNGLSVEQVNWHMEQSRREIDTFILCSVGQGSSAHHFLIRGRHAEKFNSFSQADLIAMSTAVSWFDIHSVMLRGEV